MLVVAFVAAAALSLVALWLVVPDGRPPCKWVVTVGSNRMGYTPIFGESRTQVFPESCDRD